MKILTILTAISVLLFVSAVSADEAVQKAPAGDDKKASPSKNEAATVPKKTKEELIKDAVTNPAVFGQLIVDVEMDEGVNMFVELLANLEVEKPKAEVKATRTAIMTAFMFKKWSSKSNVLADKLAQSVAPELLAPIVAAAAVVMGNQAPLVTDAFVGRAPEAYTQMIRNSGAHPETVLPPGLLVSIGLPVPHSVPATGREPTALPVAPPLKIEGPPAPGPTVERPRTPPPPEEPPPPPPVPPTYGGQ